MVTGKPSSENAQLKGALGPELGSRVLQEPVVQRRGFHYRRTRWTGLP